MVPGRAWHPERVRQSPRVKASPADLLSHFSFGGVGFVGAQYDQLAATTDSIGLFISIGVPASEGNTSLEFRTPWFRSRQIRMSTSASCRLISTRRVFRFFSVSI